MSLGRLEVVQVQARVRARRKAAGFKEMRREQRPAITISKRSLSVCVFSPLDILLAMAQRRKRRISPSLRGLAPGEQLKRSKLTGNYASPWGWVGTEVSDASKITEAHLLATCGLSKRNGQ